MSTYTLPEFDLSTAAYSDNGTVEHYYTVKTLLREVAKAEQRGAEAMREWCAEAMREWCAAYVQSQDDMVPPEVIAAAIRGQK